MSKVLDLIKKNKGNFYLAEPEDIKESLEEVPEDESRQKSVIIATYAYNRFSVCFNENGVCEDDHCRCGK
jgi:hypothetical protein